MKTINFICPHCSHLMTLPAAFEGKEGNCSSCKSSVTVVGSSGIETVARKSTTIESVAKSPTNPVLQTQSTNSIASPDTSAIRERLTRLQTAKQEYEQADAIQIQAAGKLQDAKAAVSTVFDPIGSSVVLAYTLGEINDTPLLGNVLEANRKLQQLQHDLAALEFAPAANIIQKTKVKAQRVILNQKIKQTEKQIIDCQFELGKNIFESKDYAFVACDTTKSALERLAAIQANIVEAENNLQLAISSLINLKTQLMAAVPLNAIEGTQTFDIAIGVSERQLAAIQSPAAEAPPIEPTPQTALGDPSVINVNPASQPLPQQTSQTRDRSGNRTKLVITASAVGIVILLIAGSLFIFLAGNGNTNNGETNEVALSSEAGDSNVQPVPSSSTTEMSAEDQYNRGISYRAGKDVPVDAKEAVKWFRLAAEQGHDAAQLQLGLMYLIGRGVTEDLTEAEKWIQLADKQGNTDARQVIIAIRTDRYNMEAADKAAADKAAADKAAADKAAAPNPIDLAFHKYNNWNSRPVFIDQLNVDALRDYGEGMMFSSDRSMAVYSGNDRSNTTYRKAFTISFFFSDVPTNPGDTIRFLNRVATIKQGYLSIDLGTQGLGELTRSVIAEFDRFRKGTPTKTGNGTTRVTWNYPEFKRAVIFEYFPNRKVCVELSITRTR
jgi:hypothetical protein